MAEMPTMRSRQPSPPTVNAPPVSNHYSRTTNMNSTRKPKKRLGMATTLACSTLALGSFPGGVYASSTLPSGGRVTAGQATINQTGASSLQINQSSRVAIIGWNDFSIGQGDTVHFDNGSGATLNRVTGGLPSRINGALTATGSVYLVNQSGIVVGREGRIDTGGSFVASTHDVADAAFLAGGDLTFAGTSDALVVNAGRIGSLGGDVALIARRVENTGALSAPQGTVALAAGYEVLARDAALSDGKFLVRIGGSDTAALNAGAIEAAAAELKANGGNIYALAGNTSGIIRAATLNTTGGRIVFDAGKTGAVEIAGTIDASGATGAGGSILVTGDIVRVKAGATLDASGTTGGTILLGGDYQGGGGGHCRQLRQSCPRHRHDHHSRSRIAAQGRRPRWRWRPHCRVVRRPHNLRRPPQRAGTRCDRRRRFRRSLRQTSPRLHRHRRPGRRARRDRHPPTRSVGHHHQQRLRKPWLLRRRNLGSGRNLRPQHHHPAWDAEQCQRHRLHQRIRHRPR
ncbi:filamentous hemagglutinin N-terminal domain-containing protein [Opitutaceae bacterium TAV3]|nr:filamentous hemagglutinin N-terminal domain-containing protein [Opitutaceae bacterium TAV3]